MSRLAHDLEVAARTLLRTRFISGLAIVAFALGIGVTTAVFSIFNGVLLAPLPFPHPEQLVAVYDTQPACATCPASFPKYHDWVERNQVFSAIGGSTGASFVLTGRGDPTRERGTATTASLADVFGVKPQIGRWYTAEEDQPGGPKVVVLSHDIWVRRFGGSPAVLGQTITLDGQPYEVLGVLPASFSHRRADLFVPLQRKLDPATRGNHFLVTYARLKPGIPVERAAADMRALGQTLAREFGNNHGIDVRSYYEVVVGSVRTPLHVLLGAVFCVLLIACANVANLLLASGLARRRELAIRLALGAREGDLLRQLTTESVLLALLGGALGVLLAEWVLRTFIVLAGTQLPRATTVAIDGRVLAFAAVVSVAVGLVCGVWPLLLLRANALASAVREGDTRTASGAGKRAGNALVVAEIALTFALLVGAGLLVKNLALLRSRDAGIRTEHIVAFDIEPSGQRYHADAQQLAFYRELYPRLAQMGNVESVGLTSHLPMYSYGDNGEFSIEGASPWRADEAPLVEYRWMYGNYLQTMGIPLLKGRMLDDRDRQASKAVLINEAMAGKFWPGADPRGKRFGQGADKSQWYEVVGVVGNVRSYGLARTTPFEFYRTIEESPISAMTIVIRTRGDDATAIIPTARQIVASIDPALPISQVQTMEHVVAESVGQPRLMSALTALFGGLAGLLAMVGVYGVMAYNVRRQRREFGIRLALGANQGRVRNLVVGRGLTLALAGVAIGAAGAWLLTGLLKTMLNDVKPTDLSVFVATAAAVLAVVIVASYLPARAAGRVDPMVVLRDT
ncbi:MAG TPA: ABC transporter permease [Vicinamibacterales bacterium]|nr:ABC transporter permease [Vicinamibacterales bacterium]